MSALEAVEPKATSADDLIHLLIVVTVIGIFRVRVELQDADIDPVALVEGAQSRIPDQHGALHVAVVVFHDHAEVLAQERLVQTSFL